MTNLNQAAKNEIKDIIIQIVNKEKPETPKQLTSLMQERHAVQPEQTTILIIELENEDRLQFTKQELPSPASPKEYALSKKAAWYWTTIAIAIATTISVFAIPDTAYPMVYLRTALGIIFVMFLPGFAFTNAIFPTNEPVKTSSENMDKIERVALSFGMSLVLVSIVGLILNYMPWGIRLTPITLSLLALTVVFATVAILREHQTKLNSAHQKAE